MDETSEPILVLCHTFFNDAFRAFPTMGAQQIQNLAGSRFIASFIIERYADLPKGAYCATTTEKVFDEFCEAFVNEGGAKKSFIMLEALDQIVFKVKDESITKLDKDDGIIATSDILFSCDKYQPILVTSMAPTKKEKAKKFYAESGGVVPFSIYDYTETRAFLEGKYPDICRSVKERI